MNAAIITVGDELLLGDTIDSNSSWISKELNNIGVNCTEIHTVKDSLTAIISSISYLSEKTDILFVTGGLGPTNDDKTKEAICKYFNDKLVQKEEVLNDIKLLFKKTNKKHLITLNTNQSFLPSRCKIIRNKNGTAPGMWFNEKGKQLIALPGVPFEMKEMMKDIIIELSDNSKLPVVIRSLFTVIDIPESKLCMMLEDWENNLPENLKLAYLPNGSVVNLRLTGRGFERSSVIIDIDKQKKKLSNIIDFQEEYPLIEARLGELLIKNKKTLSVAESCTSGLLSSLITKVSGSSKYYKGGVITYQDVIKENIFSIDPSFINTYTSVSKEVVSEMAEKCRLTFDSDFSVATSGYAGPTGGTKDNPIGTVFIAIASDNHILVERYVFIGDRDLIVIQTVRQAIYLLIQQINK